MLSIKVSPVAEGWAVACDAVDNPMLFCSGAKAENAAIRLGQSLAHAGKAVQIEVVLRDGARAARFVCSPPTNVA